MLFAMHQRFDILKGRTIVQIVPALDAGGVERTTVDVAAALVRAGARAVVISEGGRLEPELAAAGGQLTRFPAATKNPWNLWKNANDLAVILRQEAAVILHARSRAPAWSALLAARRTRTPLVTTWAGAYSGRSPLKKLYNSVMARGDAVIANSHWTASRITADHPWAASKISVIQRGIDLARFDPLKVPHNGGEQLRRAWNVPPGARIVLVAARLTSWKGHMILLDALAKLPDDVVTVFAGDDQGRGGYVEALRTKAQSLDIADRMFITGHVADVPAALMAADVVAVPSTEPEAFGRAAVEAQAMGVPVVVADHGAVAETVLAPPQARPSERTGWRVPPGNADELAQALHEALGLSLGERSIMARWARIHVEQHFSLTAMTNETLAVYARLLESQAGQPTTPG